MGGQPEPDFSEYPEIKLSAPWHEPGIEEMCDAMRFYGRITAREIMDTGVKVNVWDIGNEVEFEVAGVAIPPMAQGIGGAGSNLLSGIRPWAHDFAGGGWQGMALFEAPVDGVAAARPGLGSIEKALTNVRRKGE